MDMVPRARTTGSIHVWPPPQGVSAATASGARPTTAAHVLPESLVVKATGPPAGPWPVTQPRSPTPQLMASSWRCPPGNSLDALVSTLQPPGPFATTVPPLVRKTAVTPRGPTATDSRPSVRPSGSCPGLQFVPEEVLRRSGEITSWWNGRAATTSSRDLDDMASPPPVGTATGVMLVTCRQTSTVGSNRKAAPRGQTAGPEWLSCISSHGDAARSGAPVALASRCALAAGDEGDWGDAGVDEDGEHADDTSSRLASAIACRYRRR